MQLKKERGLTVNNLGEIYLAYMTADRNGIRHQLLSDWLHEHKDECYSVITCLTNWRPKLKPNHLTGALRRTYLVFAEEWEGLVDDVDEMIDMLVSESPDIVTNSFTIPEMIQSVEDLARFDSKVDLTNVFTRMDKAGATVYWRYALGEMCIGKTKILKAVARDTIYTTERLKEALLIERLHVVVEKALNGILDEEFILKAGVPFKAPIFSEWNYWTLPFEHTWIDVVRGDRYYVHVMEDGIEMRAYNMDGVEIHNTPFPLGNLPEHTNKFIIHISNYPNSIFLVEDGHDDIRIMDVLMMKGELLWDKSLIARVQFLTQNHYVHITSGTELAEACRRIKDDEYLRLLDAERGHINKGNTGGFTVRKRLHSMPLLITAGRRQNDLYVQLRLSAMDGFTPKVVGMCPILAKNIPIQLHAVLYNKEWTELEPPIVAEFYATAVSDGKIRSPSFNGLRTNLGISDVIQLGDIYARGERNG